MPKRKNTTANPLSSTVDRTSKKSEENKQFDVFQKTAVCIMLELYPDDTNYVYEDVLHHLVDYAHSHDLFYAYITHDHDIYDKTTYSSDYRVIGRKGEKKKSHTHFILVSTTSSSFVISDVFMGVTFPARFIKIVKPANIENVVLYLSHIKYINKYQYDYHDIVTNRPDYVSTLHEDYQPSGAVNFVIDYLSARKRSITFAELWDVCLNKNDIPYQQYYKNYNLIKDIVKEHNIQVREDNIQSALNDKAKTDARLMYEKDLQKFYNLAVTFGSSDLEINGKKFKLSYYGDTDC